MCQDGGTPLFVACQCGHLPVVEELVRRGANVNSCMKVSLALRPPVVYRNDIADSHCII